MNKDLSTILEVLIEEKSYLSLKEITLKFKHKKPELRTMQRELSKLVSTNRISQSGQASSTRYIIDEIPRNYPSSKFLYVYKSSIIVGLLFKLKDRFRFYYDSGYLAKYNEEIPTIKLSVEPFDFETIPAVFEENIPEGINREILETIHKEADEFEILALMDDNIGDLCFSKTKEKCYMKESEASNYLGSLDEILSTNPMINILKDYEIKMNLDEIFPQEFDLSKVNLVQTQGISGFQYKKLVNVNFEDKTISSNEATHEYILKPYSKSKADPRSDYYFPHISLNEHLHMSFAKNELGFQVPYSAILKSDEDEEFHYLVKRFDRLGLNRFTKSTFAIFLGLKSDSKYDTSSENMFKRVAKEIISPTQRMNLLKHYVYSVFIVYEDLHTKNLSIIYDKGKVLFAPLYDIACTGLYDTTHGYESMLPINGKKSQIRPNDFKRLCKLLDIDFKEFKNIANEIAMIYATQMQKYFKEIEKIGKLPIYHKKLSLKRGSREPFYKTDDKSVEFVDVLREFHKKRVLELYDLGWLE